MALPTNVTHADNSKPQTPAEREAARQAFNADKANWEWVTIPAIDLFGDPNNGVTINFEKYTCELDENGKATGKDGRYFVNPEIAKEIRHRLDVKHRAEMRVLQPNKDKVMEQIMARGGPIR